MTHNPTADQIPGHALLRLYSTMKRIRSFEEGIARLYPEKEIRCPVHLCIGQEAIPAGVCANLRKDDYVLSNHRGHGHLIAKGAGLRPIMAELFGRATGCSHGRGGSMHLIDIENNCPGTSAIVGGGMPIGAGIALASDMKGMGSVTVVFFGDGAFDQGSFHETMNFAGLKRLPLVLVCENNLYATNSRQEARHSNCDIAGSAKAYGFKGECIDGNDAVEVYLRSMEAVRTAREGKGPTLIEARTYRWLGHVGCETDFQKGLRPEDELGRWMDKCPIKRLKQRLLDDSVAGEAEIEAIDNGIKAEVMDAVSFAKASPLPEARELIKGLFED
jgi:pyruvate dehydrogenase E1 component alpha subunit